MNDTRKPSSTDIIMASINNNIAVFAKYYIAVSRKLF